MSNTMFTSKGKYPGWEKYAAALVKKVKVSWVPQKRRNHLQKLIQAENYKLREIILLKEKLSLV